MSQETLAEYAALSYKYIGKVELGKANPGADVLVRLARALRVSVGELFETITPSGTALPPPPRPRVEDADAVAAALEALTAAVERLLSESRPPSGRAPRRSSR